ncbi:MAG: TonB family protein [Aridibacter sp.]
MFVISAFSQQSDYEKGVQLYNQKQYKEAIKVFEQVGKKEETKTDARIWNYLGLSYIQISEFKDARKALEKAIKYDPQNADYRANLAYIYLIEGKYDKALSESEDAIKLDPQNINANYFRGLAYFGKGKVEEAISNAEKIIAINPSFANAYILKADSLIHTFSYDWTKDVKSEERLNFAKQAIEILNECLKKCEPPNQSIVREKLDSISFLYEVFNKKDKDESPISDETEAKIKQDATGIKVLTKPVPGYTNLARSSGTQGEILLAVSFESNGKIGYVVVIKGLENGLTENAINAAKRIQFEPATRDGKPISLVKRIQYNFTVY